MREKLGENGHKRNEAINLQKKDAFVKRDERHSTTIKMSGNYAAVKWRTVEIKKKLFVIPSKVLSTATSNAV